MATAGEGPSATPSSGYEGNGGVGGKFRKRPFRKTNATPYDRPPTAFRNPSWLSKHIMEPASKLVTSGYQLFFSSLFRKRLPAPPPPPIPPELNQDTGREHPGRVQEAGPQETAVDDGAHLARSPREGVMSDLEQLLKKKTFTRSEIDRLTGLLQSRAVDFPHQNDVKKTELSNVKLAANSDMQRKYVASPSEGIKIQNDMSHGPISTPGISKQVLEEDIASPAKIAKAYMGHQASKVSPSVLGSRMRAVREDATLLSDVPFTPKTTMMSSVAKGVPENGFTTPGSRGRSAIYNMARTPYSRVPQTAFEKGSGSKSNGFGGLLLPSPSGKDLHGEIGSNRMGLKRRSSVLDDDYGSLGPMRRTRQKPSILSLRSQHPFTNERVYKGPKFAVENDDIRTLSARNAHVPPKSTETASKIMEHLERMTPPKKFADLKLIAAKEKSPAKLTTDMLRGQALKSLEDADYSNLLYSDQVVNKLENVSRGKEVNSGAPQGKDRIEENKLQKFGSPSNVAVHVENSDIPTSGKSTIKNAETSESVAKFVVQQPQKKQAFMMSAHEDLLDWDDDANLNGSASEVLPKDGANSEIIENKLLFPAKKSLSESADSGDISGDKTSASMVVAAVPSNLGSEIPKLASAGEPSIFAQTKPDMTSRTYGIFSTVITASLKNPGSKGGIDNTVQEVATTNGKVGTSPTEDLSSSAQGVSFILPGYNTNNGPPTVTPSTVPSASSPASAGVVNSFLTNGTSKVSSFVSTSGSFSSPALFPAASSSALSLSTEQAALLKMPSSNFGSSGNSSMSTFSTPNPELPVTRNGKEENTGKSNLSSGNAAVVTIGTGNSPFVFGSKVTPSRAVSQSQDSLSSLGNGSMPNSQNLVAGSEASTEMTSTPVKFSDPASSPAFGTFGASSFTSSNSFFNSTPTAANPFSSSITNLGHNTSGSLSESKSSGPSTSATLGIFNFMSKTSSLSPSTESNPASTSSATTTSLSYNSSGLLSETNAFGPSTSATPGIFNFMSKTSSLSPSTQINPASSSSATTTSLGHKSSGSLSETTSFGPDTSATPGIFNFMAKTSTLSASTESNPASSSGATTTSNTFGGIWPVAKPSALVNGSSFGPSASTGFSFGSSSNFGSTTASTASMVFGASTSGPAFFTAASAPTPSPSPFGAQPVFIGGAQSFAAPAPNNDQMSTEDSMAEDPVQSSMPAPTPVFGQPHVSPAPGGFMFSSPAPTPGNTFQFGGQQSQPASQNQSLFQGSGSQEFGGGSFSLGSGHGGGDKAGRRIVKVQRNNRNRKK